MFKTDKFAFLNHVNNGVLMLDEAVNVLFWNEWLFLHTGIKPENAVGKGLAALFPELNERKLARKLMQAKTLKTPSYYNGSSDKYLIPIGNKSLVSKHYSMMQQDVTISYMPDDNCYLVTLYDCTPYLDMEQRLLDTNKELNTLAEINKKYSVSKSEFLAHTSHELRTPLNSLLGFIDLLRSTTLSKEQKEFLGVIKDSSHAMLDIVNSVMSISEVEKGILEFKPTECSISDTMKSSAELFYAKVLQKYLGLICYIDPKIPSKVYADGSKIRQILLNFISNAIKFTPEGGCIYVSAVLESLDKGVADIRISVKDTGKGMDKEFLDKIFLPYEREESLSYFEGSGVGLYICSKFAELMQTRITVDSAPGEGSEFSFLLTAKVTNSDSFNDIHKAINGMPLDVIFESDDERLKSVIKSYLSAMGVDARVFYSVEDIAEQSAGASDVLLIVGCSRLCDRKDRLNSLGYETILCINDNYCNTVNAGRVNEKLISYKGILDPKSFYLLLSDAYLPQKDGGSDRGGRRILVMEDNRNNQMLMQVIFDKLGAVVDVASNGEAGLIYFKQNVYDLVLIDINMPVKNGLETITDIKEYAAKAGVDLPPMYALTAHAFVEKQEEYLSYGFDGYLVKPVNVSVLTGLLSYDNISSSSMRAASKFSGNSMKDVINRLQELADLDWDDMQKLLDMFFASVFQDIRELSGLLNDKDQEGFASKAHYMKGQFLSFYLHELSKTFAEMESMDVGSNSEFLRNSILDIRESLNELQAEYEDIKRQQAD